MKNKTTYKNYYYNCMVSKLDTKVYQKNYKAKEDFYFKTTGNNEEWISTSTKEVELKKVLSKIKSPDYNNKNRVYTYSGHVIFDNKKLSSKVVRSLIEIEPRFLKDIYEYVKRLKDEVKEEKLKTKKYELLFKYKTEINKYNETLIRLNEEYKEEEDKWNSLNEYHYTSSDEEYCDFDYLSEEEQINRTTEHNEKISSLNKRISSISTEIENSKNIINDILENGISEDLIANYYS